jgi:hypothetical protein
MAMIRAEGGVGEVFLLPVILIVPGTTCALVGGVLGTVARWTYGVGTTTKHPVAR